MFQITQLTSDPAQTQTLVLPDGTSIGLSLQYAPLQQVWNITSLTFGSSFVLNGIQIAVNPNLLHQWRNIIPFGLGCFANGTREPSQISDFSSGYASLYILTADETAAYAASLAAGTASGGA